MKKVPTFFSLFLFLPFSIFAQCVEDTNGQFIDLNGGPCLNTIVTAVPFLDIETNPQSVGLAGIGVVASPFNYSTALSQNPALLMRDKEVLDVQVSYMPWLRRLEVDNVRFLDFRFGASLDKRQAVGLNITHFSFGEISFIDPNGNPIGSGSPEEYNISGHYARQLSPAWSIGMGFNYFVSDLASGLVVAGQPIGKATSFALDFGVHHQKKFLFKNQDKLHWNVGLSVINLGPKISYFENSLNGDFIPSSLKLGTLFTYEKAIKSNTLYFSLAYQANKLLVPSPCLGPNCDLDNNGIPDHREQSVISAAINSFSDAPNGASEEWAEFTHHIGMESWWVFSKPYRVGLRGGYFSESITKGGRKYYSVGASFNFHNFAFNFGHIFSAKSASFAFIDTFSVGVGYNRIL